MTVTLTPAEIETFRGLVLQRLGLAFDETKVDQLADVLRGRIAAHGHTGGEPYLGRLARTGAAAEEWRLLAERLTVTETYFFRYWDHFRAFAEIVLPERLSAGGHEVRILSAGCASGEEAYSLAILVRDRLDQLAEAPRIRITAIDINGAMIRKALRGHYSSWSLRDTPRELSDRNFRADGREFVLNEAVRSMVTFEERNLVEPDPVFWAPMRFDVVFCRNVTMYFATDVARLVVDRIARSLVPGGYLFLGHAETLRGLSDAFHLRHTHGAFYYQRPSACEHRATHDFDDRMPVSPVLQSATAALPSADTSWVDAILHASERIAALARAQAPDRMPSVAPPTAPLAPSAAPAPRARGLGAVVDLLMRERFDDAFTALNSVSEESTGDPDAQLLRAVIMTNRGDFDGVRRTCQRILAIDEFNAGAHYLLALCHEHDGDRREAMEHDRTSAYLDPAFAMPRFHLGLLAKRRGDLAGARGELERALALFPREDSSRILFFGGGFSREALMELCRREIGACGGAS